MNIQNPSVPRPFNPKRRDKVLEEMAKRLGNSLSWLTHNFGRAYEFEEVDSEGDTTRFPAVYSETGDYTNVSQNSFLKASTYFILGEDDYTNDYKFQFPLSIIFLLNLKEIYPTADTYQATERLINDATHVLNYYYSHDFKKTTTQQKFENVFSEFDDLSLNKFKRYPMDSFRINGIFTMDDVCLGTTQYPSDQGPLSGEVDNFVWEDGDNFVWEDGDNFVWED